MTEIEKHALVIFKDYTMLQLKAFYAHEIEKYSKGAGGATEPYPTQVLNQAIAYHREYMKLKLNGDILKEEGSKFKQTELWDNNIKK